MAPHITCQTILLPVTRSGVVDEGLLVFADDVLMAAVTRLEQSLDEELRNVRGRWHLETGFGPCAVAQGTDVLFGAPDEVQAWVLERTSRAG